MHQRLARMNGRRMRPTLPTADGWYGDVVQDVELRVLEGEFVEEERRAVLDRAATAPTDPDAFVRWFEALEATGPGQHDPLFPWLSAEATEEDVRWFLRQEVAGEAGFDDLVALSQLKLPEQAKLEMARNSWDEMGQGREAGMHGPMLARLAETLHLHDDDGADIVWESLALGNLLIALAANRRYAYHAIGVLGAIELTAPRRAGQVNAALKRLGHDAHVRQYFALHATLDVKHSEAWNREVLRPLVASQPRVARGLAEGALMRLRAGARCFDRYRAELWGNRGQ
ncbi:MAG: iron-containing redox enzyme family protein [Polyangiales bacterium]